MISATPPNQGGKGYLIGDIKYSASMFTGRYISSNRSSQFAAIVGYARHNQYFPVAVFACAYSGGPRIQEVWTEKVKKSGLANGVYLMLISGDSIRRRR